MHTTEEVPVVGIVMGKGWVIDGSGPETGMIWKEAKTQADVIATRIKTTPNAPNTKALKPSRMTGGILPTIDTAMQMTPKMTRATGRGFVNRTAITSATAHSLTFQT